MNSHFNGRRTRIGTVGTYLNYFLRDCFGCHYRLQVMKPCWTCLRQHTVRLPGMNSRMSHQIICTREGLIALGTHERSFPRVQKQMVAQAAGSSKNLVTLGTTVGLLFACMNSQMDPPTVLRGIGFLAVSTFERFFSFINA